MSLVLAAMEMNCLDWHKEPNPIYEFSQSEPKTLVDAHIPGVKRDKWTIGLIAAGIVSPSSCISFMEVKYV